MIGDYQPEDAWDDGDPVDDKLTILELVALDLSISRDDPFHDARARDALRLVAKLSPRSTARLVAIRHALIEELVDG